MYLEPRHEDQPVLDGDVSIFHENGGGGEKEEAQAGGLHPRLQLVLSVQVPQGHHASGQASSRYSVFYVTM